MKKIILPLVLAFCGIITSCDFVSNPVENAVPTTSTGSTVIMKKVLLEDFTGHKCGNCPGATREAMRLDSIYPNQIIMLGVHAGFYAGLGVNYTTDFRNVTSTDYDNTFGISSAGNPNGMVNRKGFPSAQHIIPVASWAAQVSSNLNLPADFKLEIVPSYNAGTRSLNVDVKTTALKNIDDTLNLVILLVEDSIIAEQLDYSVTPDYIPNYVHRHVLRGAINGSFGTALQNVWSTNQEVTSTITNFAINSNFNDSHCHIVAYIFKNNPSNSNAYREVVQVEEIKMR